MDDLEIDVTVLRKEKRRLVKKCAELRSKMEDTRTEILALRREFSRLKKEKEADIQNAIDHSIENLMREIGE